MKTNNKMLQTVSRQFNKIGFQLQKRSPEIMLVTGIVGVVVTTVMACKATTKAGKVAETTKETLDNIHEAKETGVTKANESYSEADAQKDLVEVYTGTAKEYVKLYAPSVIVGVASISCIVLSHRIQKQRNAALVANLTATTTAFKNYRNRVAERFGEQVEKELRYNIKAQDIEQKITDEKGKTKTVKKPANVPAAQGWDPSQYSPYARLFDETNPSWMVTPDQNRYYLKARQAQANDTLKMRGHLFLNEIYDMLGFPRTKMGAVVGWIYDPKRPEFGDSFVDFSIIDVDIPTDDGGFETRFILDFNAVGDITDDIADHQYNI